MFCYYYVYIKANDFVRKKSLCLTDIIVIMY